jgi:glycosyltransferase involved in cell wall biosynthesis
MAPDISVVIPTRNRHKLLALTLRSVCEQKEVDLEVIVVDDGSDDDAAANVIATRADARVRLIRNPTSLGVSATRNRGIASAVGRWVALCDDDDLWAPDKLKEQVTAARQSGRSWVYAGAVKIDAALRIIGGEPPPRPEVVHRRLPRWTLVPGGCSGVIVKRDLLRSVGGFDPSLMNLADWDLWSRLAQHSPPAWAPLPLVGYRIHSGSSSRDTSLVLRELDVIDGRYGVRVDRAAVHHYLAWVCLRSGRRTRAGRHFMRAAIHGELWGVARSTSALLSTTVRAAVGRPPPCPPHTAWLTQADLWLEPLRRGSESWSSQA